MKEHVLIFGCTTWEMPRYESKVNEWLDNGWTVKSVTISSDKEESVLVVVLQHGADR